jgi:hypothetical protein
MAASSKFLRGEIGLAGLTQSFTSVHQCSNSTVQTGHHTRADWAIAMFSDRAKTDRT